MQLSIAIDDVYAKQVVDGAAFNLGYGNILDILPQPMTQTTTEYLVQKLAEFVKENYKQHAIRVAQQTTVASVENQMKAMSITAVAVTPVPVTPVTPA